LVSCGHLSNERNARAIFTNDVASSAAVFQSGQIYHNRGFDHVDVSAYVALQPVNLGDVNSSRAFDTGAGSGFHSHFVTASNGDSAVCCFRNLLKPIL
jgi:hypothetical protein